MKLNALYIILLIILVRCNDDCNHYDVVFKDQFKLNMNAPVFIGSNLVGSIKETIQGKDNMTAKVCIRKEIKIPLQSQWQAGYIKAFGMPGINILLSTDTGYIRENETIQGIYLDSISVNFPDTDSALVNEVISIMESLSKKDTTKR